MMKLYKKIYKYLTNSNYRFLINCNKGFCTRMSDEEFLSKQFFILTGKKLNLEHPISFNEKLQWQKINDRKDFYWRMVDKFEAKNYVREIDSSINVIKTLGVWNKFDEIDFSKLPNQFVLKCTHDSGGLVICKDKSVFDKKNAKKSINKCLKRDFFEDHREFPYKDVPKRIIAEEYMDDGSGVGLMDYKFYCFNGEPKFLYISKGLEHHETASISFLNLDWTFAPYERSDFKPFKELPEKPSCFDEMIEHAKKLSKGMTFLRVDLYQIDNKVFFSELTFYPCAGYMPFKDEVHNIELGQMIKLPIDK